MPRFFCPAPLRSGDTLELPATVARHVQVLRLQPGMPIRLFNLGPGGELTGPGGEFDATITRMGRSDVAVEIGAHHAVDRQPSREVHLAVGMPANERMDWLVEKAVELGVASIQPLMTERSVLRLSGDRADKKIAHWQSVAIAACEQCGGNRVPLVAPVQTLPQWLSGWRGALPADTRPYLLSLRDGSLPLRDHDRGDGGDLGHQGNPAALFLSGPEGGLSASEEQIAIDAGFQAVTLGARVLRAETAALTALARLTN